MKIVFLGTSHGNPEANRFCSSTAIYVGNKVYVIDAGAPILPLLLSRGVHPKDIGGIFITHAHDDHYLGLIEYTRVINLSQEYHGVSTPVLVPRKRLYSEILNTKYNFKLWHGRGRTKYKKYRKGVIFDDGTIKVTAIPVKHIFLSYAFIVEAEGKRILFSGDLARGMKDYPTVLFDKNFDLLILEAAHTIIDTPGVLDKINRSKIDRLVINHINPYRNTPEVLSSAFSKVNPSVQCIAALDGMEIDL